MAVLAEEQGPTGALGLASIGTAHSSPQDRMPIQGGFGLLGAVRGVVDEVGYLAVPWSASVSLQWNDPGVPAAGWWLILVELSSQ